MNSKPELNDCSTPERGDCESRVPAVRLTDFETVSDIHLAAPWEYNRRLYEIWAIYDHWPAGYLMSIAGPSAGGVTIQAVWASQQHETQYMATTGIDRYTEAVRVLTGEEGLPPVDLLPNNRPITYLGLGPRAADFLDIGADLDEAAGKQFGTALTAVDFEAEGLSDEQEETLWQQLDLVENTNPKLIMRLAVGGESGRKNTLIWVSPEAASSFVDEELLPAYSSIAPGEEEQPQIELREIRRIAIGSSEIGRAQLDSLSP